jgi:KDO2-lipid IV(A) palmitoleoyltransferase
LKALNLNQSVSAGQGVMVVGVHFMSLELGGRTMGLCRPMMATYRPHNSPLMEWVQTRGRLRSNKAMIDRRNLSVWCMPESRRSGMVCPGSGLRPEGQRVCAVLLRPSGGNDQRHLRPVASLGCENAEHQHGAQAGPPRLHLHISDVMNDYPGEDKQDAASYINKVIEKEILRAPEQYLWVHRRLKPARWANLPLLSLPAQAALSKSRQLR